jgi:Ca2+-binding EF-hand superfamily protein
LSADELMNVWEASFNAKISPSEARAIIAQADGSGKGFVTYEEFIKMWQNI